MKTVQSLHTWELHYNESSNALHLLVNGNVIFSLTHENIMDFLEAVSDASGSVIFLAQPMIPQQVHYEIEVNEDDGTEEEYSVLNWNLSDADLPRFASGPQEIFTLEFDEAQDRQMLLNDLLNHEATGWLTLDY